ncbi:hypothetical protein NL108_016046, partial [Boleophthalmus pectinirostris]
GYELKDKDLGKVHKAASVGDLAKLKQLATKQKNDLNQLDKENRTALHIACAAGHVEVVQFLVESKAKLNLCDNQIRSALMKAVQGQHESCINILLENHADPNLVDINGNTALHLAASIPSVSTAGLLLEHEANINAPNKEGLTPLTVAVREDHNEMAEFLLKEGADVNATDDNKSCSHLIDNHATQKSDGTSLLHQDQGKSKKKFVSKSGADDWPSSDNDDESPMIQKVCFDHWVLGCFCNSLFVPVASAQLDTSLSGVESEPEPELVPQTAPPLPKALPSTSAPSNPVDPHPETLPFKPPRMSSTPLSSYNKVTCGKNETTETTANIQSEEFDQPHESEEDDEDQSSANNDLLIGSDSQNKTEIIKNPENSPTSSSQVKDKSTENITNLQNKEFDLLKDVSNSPQPVRLDVKEDCIVSAIRVESKFSDEEDSVGAKACVENPPKSAVRPGNEESDWDSLSEDEDAIPRKRKSSWGSSIDSEPELPADKQPNDTQERSHLKEITPPVEGEATMSKDVAVELAASPKSATKPAESESDWDSLSEDASSKDNSEKNHASIHQECSSQNKDMSKDEVKAETSSQMGFRHVNGNPLSVFDDSSLSDVSEDEGRYKCILMLSVWCFQHSEEVEMAEDFDDLTQSSDTATDDLDSPSAGYRHAALLVDKLDSTSLDSRNMVKLQNIFHEYERTIQKLKSRHSYLSDKVNQLEMERVDMKNSLEEIKEVKSTLERNQLELQTEVTNLKFQLKQEQENRRNATMMYNTTKDKLKRTEEQQQLEVQEKQKVELTLRNLELEMRTLVNNMKQASHISILGLEEDHSETQRLLAQERSARALQENLLNGHLRKQQEIEAENKRNISKSNEALSQLTEASDRERELLQQTSSLQEQISILRADLERSQANSSLKESHLLEENETLKEQLEDSRREVKANSEALTQTVFNCNNQLTTLKSELAITTNRFENEKQARETLEKEVESTRTRLTGAVQEAERCMAATADTEKALLREKEESQRLKDRLTAEGASHREAVSTLTQKLSKAEAQANSLENEVHRVTLQLTEKGLLLDVLQKEKDALGAKVKDLDKALQTQKELATKTGARHEATQERLAQAQSEGMLLRQQLEEANNKGDAKEKAVTHAQERFSDMLSKLRSDCEERVQLVEERNKELASKAADLRDQVYKLEEEKNDRETNLRQLQQELADSLKKLSMSEASLEVNTRYRNDLEEEKARILRDSDRLREKLAESEDQYVQAEKRYNSLKSNFDDAEKELAITAQRLQEALLEIENAKLEAAAKQQSNKIEALQKGAQEAALIEIEKKKVKKISEQKKAADARLDQEISRNSDLQKEMYRLRTLLKTAKKKMRDQDMGAEFNSPMNSLRMEMSRLNQDPRKVCTCLSADDLQVQLDRESLRRSQLEKENSDLREELASLKHSGQNRQRTEEELQELRRQIEGAQREQSQAEERARHELQHKLEQVNLFLQ